MNESTLSDSVKTDRAKFQQYDGRYHVDPCSDFWEGKGLTHCVKCGGEISRKRGGCKLYRRVSFYPEGVGISAGREIDSAVLCANCCPTHRSKPLEEVAHEWIVGNLEYSGAAP